MAFSLLYALFEGIMANAALMAVKAMNATDVQLRSSDRHDCRRPIQLCAARNGDGAAPQEDVRVVPGFAGGGGSAW